MLYVYRTYQCSFPSFSYIEVKKNVEEKWKRKSNFIKRHEPDPYFLKNGIETPVYGQEKEDLAPCYDFRKAGK